MEIGSDDEEDTAEEPEEAPTAQPQIEEAPVSEEAGHTVDTEPASDSEMEAESYCTVQPETTGKSEANNTSQYDKDVIAPASVVFISRKHRMKCQRLAFLKTWRYYFL